MERNSPRLVLSKKDGPVGTISLNRPDSLNAFNLDLARQFIEGIGEFGRDEEIRVIVVRGEGKVFSAGGDIREMLGYVKDGKDRAAYFRAPLAAFGEMVMAVRSLPKPVVAPTIIDLAGIDAGIPGEAGYSLLRPYPRSHVPKYLLLERDDKLWSATVSDSYKFILREDLDDGDVDTLLFDLVADKGEKKNLFLERKDIADSLALYLEERVKPFVVIRPDTANQLTPDEVQRLRALGYVN